LFGRWPSPVLSSSTVHIDHHWAAFRDENGTFGLDDGLLGFAFMG
jgi:hypothetical protein